ncbi:putative mediator of RNA polymerase II transcription subunit 26b [Canna indica]|uniref:Mediator of RNA polymerase II transcription subunit 26b n=1 Tax=Canna indica TaxID=4628 RepID=A0AAQ3Q4P9_9LILI|nr:putative mediator of RNA polymerase II transcription subunit 26b [Canna indica]
MAGLSGSLDYWRKFFRSANSDIFEVMEQAVLVAASDFPEEFRSRRDQIVEKMFTLLLPRCYGCNRVAEGEEGDRSVKRDGEKESKVDSNDGPEDLNRIVSNYSFDEAEALTEELEEKNQTLAEVTRIKEIFANFDDESDGLLFESLRRLQLMELSVEVLMATEIGRAVNGLRKHKSKQIRHLARTLIDGWKVLVDEWVSATAAIADNSPDSVNPLMEDEDGLPSPPLDEGALFATETAPIRFSEFFDEMDDDGNLRNNEELESQQGNGRNDQVNDRVRKQQPFKQSISPKEKGESRRQEPRHLVMPDSDDEMWRQEPQRLAILEPKRQMRQQESVIRQTKPKETLTGQEKHESIMNKQRIPVSGPGRPKNSALEQKTGGHMKPKLIQDNAGLRRKSSIIPQDVCFSGLKLLDNVDLAELIDLIISHFIQKTKNSEEALIRARLEVAKRKLQEGYQQAENAKKQRTIQVMELHDLPKQAHNRHPVSKFKNQIRGRAGVRH